MNLLSGRAYIGETDLNLTQKEFAALLYLARHPKPQRQRAGAVRGGLAAADGETTACRAHDDLALKQKLGGEDRGSRSIRYRSSGYRLEEQ